MRSLFSWRHAPVVAIAAPVVLFLVLRLAPQWDSSLGGGTSHFYVVSAVAALSFALALAVVWAARSVPDPRVTFLALGLLSMAAIFLAHGLGTSPLFASGNAHGEPVEYDYRSSWFQAPAPGGTNGAAPGVTPEYGAAAIDPNGAARLRVVGYSAQLSITVAALFFLLATLDLGATGERVLARWYRTLIGATAVALSAHVYVALWFPTLLAPLPLSQRPVQLAVAAVTTAALVFAAWRFAQAYRLALLPLQGAMAFAMIMLLQAQWFQVLAPSVWALSWWEYHVTMLAGFAVAAVALLRQYRLAGDLSVIVEGLFLRSRIRDLRRGDPEGIRVLSAAVAAKDTETAEHIDRVGDMAVAMGERLWLPSDRIDVLRWSGRLHDVGKLGVPNSILRKPGALTPAEFEVIKQHAPRGWQIARASGILRETAPIIRSHHERLDGTGYPDGLEGDAIPFEARIVAVADVWDALTSDRPYRGAMSDAEALELIRSEAGTHFEPDCVRALLDVLGVSGGRQAA